MRLQRILIGLSLGFTLCSSFAYAEPRTFRHQRIAPNQAGQRRWLSSTGLQYTENVLRGVMTGSKNGQVVFHGGPRGALSTVEDAWTFAHQNPNDPRVSIDDQGDGVKVYVVDMNREIGTFGKGTKAGELPANHVRLVVARDRYLLSASATRGAHADGTNWPSPKQVQVQHPAQTLDDAALAKALVDGGANPVVAARAVDHARLGLPSPATYTSFDDRLRVRNGYIISVNGNTKTLNWVAWMLKKDHVDHGAPRADNWRNDPTLGADFPLVSGNDYRGAGDQYHRGHIVRSRERSAKQRENKKTFLYQNAPAQARNVNIGPWNGFEEWVQAQLDAGYEVATLGGVGYAGPKLTLGEGMPVPSFDWKLVGLFKPGQKAATANTRLVAIKVPNTNSVPLTANWADFRVSPEQLERDTGLRFFSNLPQALADQLRKQTDSVAVPYVMPPHVKEELDRAVQRRANRKPGQPQPSQPQASQQPPAQQTAAN